MAKARYLALVAALTGCSAVLPVPNDSHVARLKSQDPEVTLAALEVGRSLYVERCSGCHTLKEPRRFSTEAWVDAMRKMEVVEGVKLEPDVARDIQRYLVAMSSAGAEDAR